jgi:Flp pilus assembly protein TadG
MRSEAVKNAKRKGQAVIELTVSIVIFAIMLCIISSLSMYLYVQHAVVSAAREGARYAAVSQDFENGDDADGITAVKGEVIDFFDATTGQTLELDDITVTPPQDPDDVPVGQRTVTVTVEYDMTNPIPIGDFLEDLGVSDASSLKEIPVAASATMRFEE